MIDNIDLLEGKYTIQRDNGTNFKALRYGKEWRDLTGDGLMLALVFKIEELQEEVYYWKADFINED